jgi:hypothetical protein
MLFPSHGACICSPLLRIYALALKKVQSHSACAFALVLFDRNAYKEDMISVTRSRNWAPDSLLVSLCAVLGIAACLGDLYMTHLLGTWYPGYRPLFQPMSDLGEDGSPVALITSAWWVIMGLMFIAFGYGFYRALAHHGKPAKLAAWMLALYGIGEGLGSGLVPGFPGGSFRTPGSVVHNLLGGVGVTAAFLLPFLIMKIFRAQQRPALYWQSWFTTVTGIFFFILFSISTFFHPEGSWISYTGLWQRLFMLMYYIFFIWLAIIMLTGKTSISR